MLLSSRIVWDTAVTYLRLQGVQQLAAACLTVDANPNVCSVVKCSVKIKIERYGLSYSWIKFELNDKNYTIHSQHFEYLHTPHHKLCFIFKAFYTKLDKTVNIYRKLLWKFKLLLLIG